MSILSLGDEADAPSRALWEEFGPLFTGRMQAWLDHQAKEWSRCGHVNPRDPQLLDRLGMETGWVFFEILQGTSAKAVERRAHLRTALVITGEYDGVASEVHELAKAVRRREVYNVVRRAAVLLEQLDASDAAAVLAEYALAHEPGGDGVEFSRIRKRKNELQ
jgi:hypothetical protein